MYVTDRLGNKWGQFLKEQEKKHTVLFFFWIHIILVLITYTNDVLNGFLLIQVFKNLFFYWYINKYNYMY